MRVSQFINPHSKSTPGLLDMSKFTNKKVEATKLKLTNFGPKCSPRIHNQISILKLLSKAKVPLKWSSSTKIETNTSKVEFKYFPDLTSQNRAQMARETKPRQKNAQSPTKPNSNAEPNPDR